MIRLIIIKLKHSNNNLVSYEGWWPLILIIFSFSLSLRALNFPLHIVVFKLVLVSFSLSFFTDFSI